MKVIINSNLKEREDILNAIKINDGYCPCVLTKTEDSKCQCKHFREEVEQGWCHCGLFFKIKENKNEEEY